jgi:FkbM family methyltransferase
MNPCSKKFRRLIEINGINNVIIHSFGLGNEDSKKPFYRPPDINLGIGFFVPGFSEENTPDSALEIHKRDDVLEYSGIGPVGLITMDIEGYEKPALLGLQRTLRKDRPVSSIRTDRESPKFDQYQEQRRSPKPFTTAVPFCLLRRGNGRGYRRVQFQPGDQIRFDTRSG